MTKDEALKLALEALKANDLLINGTEKAGGLAWCIDGYYSDCFDIDPINEQTERAITAIREALAQPEQNQFNPDWDAMAVMVEEQQRMAKRIAELEAQQEPLTDEEIWKVVDQCKGGRIDFARAIEAAHGIWPENSDCHGPDWTDRDGEYLK